MKKFLFLLLILLITATAYAARIELKSGLVVDGEILEQTNKYIRINFEGVDLKFYLDEIDTVDGQTPEAKDYPDPPADTKASTVENEEESYKEIFQKSREKSAERYGVSSKLASVFEPAEEIEDQEAEIFDDAAEKPFFDETVEESQQAQLAQEEEAEDIDLASQAERRIQEDAIQMKQFLAKRWVPFAGLIVDFFAKGVREKIRTDPAFAKKILKSKSFKEQAESGESAQPVKTCPIGRGKPLPLIAYVFGFIFVLFAIVAGWKVCSKAGYPGWSQLIPIYGQYVQCKMAGKPGWWLLLLFIPYVSIVFYFIVMISIARNFGKSVLFGIGMVFLPFIFWPILAFGKSEYIG